ncbi:hypothetical protein D3C85_1436100 [compost metagenome]
MSGVAGYSWLNQSSSPVKSVSILERRQAICSRSSPKVAMYSCSSALISKPGGTSRRYSR